MQYTPLLGLMGHRQVGKTTLLEGLCQDYFSLDSPENTRLVEKNPRAFLKQTQQKWTVLDECQTTPIIFFELKEWVRLKKKPGQFILSGSVRFTSREQIRESLTGRIINLELLPLSASEIAEEPLSDFCLKLVKSSNLKHFVSDVTSVYPYNKSLVSKKQKRMTNYFTKGGLPGLCFIRNEQIMKQKMTEQLNTILDRDLRMVKKIHLSLSEIWEVFRAVAKQQGRPLNLSEIKKQTGVSSPSIKKILYAMEALYLRSQDSH